MGPRSCLKRYGGLLRRLATPISGDPHDATRNQVGHLVCDVVLCFRRLAKERIAIVSLAISSMMSLYRPMMSARIALASSRSANSDASPPQISGSHSLGRTSMGPIASPVRKPSSSDNIMPSGGERLDTRNLWSASKSMRSVISRARASARIATSRIGTVTPSSHAAIARSGRLALQSTPVPRQQFCYIAGLRWALRSEYAARGLETAQNQLPHDL